MSVIKKIYIFGKLLLIFVVDNNIIILREYLKKYFEV